jgi:pyruvate ferredoxin oxidoreductase beta subunit
MSDHVNEVLSREEILRPGHLACPGCAVTPAYRWALKVLGRETMVTAPACCFAVIDGAFPFSASGVPFLHAAFEAAPAYASGVRAALDVTGKSATNVLVWAGDGGTFDIGLQSLSAAAERGEDMIYVCYDNEAYMNTGIQRSSATPPTARTATTMAVGKEPGNVFGTGKNVALIAMAHNIPYVATASVANLRDLEFKVTRAMGLHGSRYIHIHVPCPLGWGSAPADTIKVARMAVESGLFPLIEAEHGEVTGRTKIRHKVPVTEYLKLQKRFAHLFGKTPDTDRITHIQEIADRNIAKFGLLEAEPANG